ncbi:MAG: hypothetical protein D6689_05855 [Deltaproteobacteria bacterium]|nr:MAG: hypothetical protein D6689_05855 [Deltaproteobacteria bacterium]
MTHRGMSRAALAAGLVSAIVSLAPRGARAQEPEFDAAIDLNLFEYATGRHTFLTVPDVDVIGDRQFNVDFLITFLTNPLTIYNVQPVGDGFEIDDMNPERTEVVERMLAGILGGAYGLRDEFEIGVALPVTLSMDGQGLDLDTAMPSNGLSAAGLGDLRAEFKWRFWQRDRWRLAAIPAVTLPTSVGKKPDGRAFSDGGLLGDNLPTFRARAAAQWSDSDGNLRLGAHLGAIFRKPRTLYSSEIGQQLAWGAAGAFRVTDRVDAVAEVFGRSDLFGADLDASPVEVNGALRVQATSAFSVVAGGGAGIVRGIGSPGLRVFVSVGWQPDFRDSDNDGVRNDRDQCPLVPEDKDGYQDADGCPDNDNDGDKREDSIDKCPNEPEDIDGFEDDDGCPEPDNDKDGIPDADDRCPVDAEDGKPPFAKDGCPADKRDSDDDGTVDAYDQCPDDPEDEDGFEDWDGCPDVDNDGDEIPDEFDECPLCKEDADGYHDEDGCPDLDNDGDGIPDAADQCPAEAEVINGVDDFDGCPDDGGVTLVTLDGDRMTIDGSVDFTRGDRLSARGKVYADQIAAQMLAHPDVTKWRVVVVGDQSRIDRAAAQRRADALKARIQSRGIAAERVEAIGAVSDTAMVAVVVLERAAGAGEGARQCPAGMEAVERQPPATPAPTTTDASAAADAPASGDAPVASAPAQVPDAFSPYAGVVEVHFRRNTATLRRGKAILDEVADLLLAHPDVRIEVIAHTDSRKGPDKSREITQAQADAVKAYLVAKGVPAERISAVGRGMDEPIADNRKSSGRAKNRRIEFAFSVQ